MSGVRINEFDCGGARRAELLLGNIPGASDRVIRKAAEKAAAFLRTESRRLVRKRYAISAANLRDSDTASVRYSVWDGAGVTVTYAGYKIPLYRYEGTTPKRPGVNSGQKKVAAIIAGRWRSIYPSLSAQAHVFKATSPYRLFDAFVATMPNGHTGIFERNGGKSQSGGDAISELMGLSVPQMIGNAEVRDELSKRVVDKFNEVLELLIAESLRGMGNE